MITNQEKACALIEQLKIIEELYKYVCLEKFESPKEDFFFLLAQRRKYYREDIKNRLGLAIDADHLILQNQRQSFVDHALDDLRLVMAKDDFIGLLDFFIKKEKMLQLQYEDIIENSTYDYLTVLLIFECHHVELLAQSEELNAMSKEYRQAESSLPA